MKWKKLTSKLEILTNELGDIVKVIAALLATFVISLLDFDPGRDGTLGIIKWGNRSMLAIMLIHQCHILVLFFYSLLMGACIFHLENKHHHYH